MTLVIMERSDVLDKKRLGKKTSGFNMLTVPAKSHAPTATHPSILCNLGVSTNQTSQIARKSSTKKELLPDFMVLNPHEDIT